MNTVREIEKKSNDTAYARLVLYRNLAMQEIERNLNYIFSPVDGLQNMGWDQLRQRLLNSVFHSWFVQDLCKPKKDTWKFLCMGVDSRHESYDNVIRT